MAVTIALRQASSFHVPKRCHHLFLLHHSPSPRYSSDFSQVREKMISRQLPYGTDYMTLTQSRALRLTLADFLPHSREVRQGHSNGPLVKARDGPLAPTHHLVHFPNVPPSSLLLPDGTDSLHSPGPPFTRRMWAGGSMAFLQDIPLNGRPFHYTQSIADVQIKGKEGEEKIYVRVERVIFAGRYPGEVKGQPNSGLYIAEQRSLVFMRDNRQEDSSSKVLKPTETPDFSHTMVPTRELLFRFSALTFNAHAIHLDKQFCREVEGHRNLLVHGPLTVMLMIEILQSYLHALAYGGGSSFEGTPEDRMLEKITHVEYKNLAPLYAEEEMRICVKRRQKEMDRRRTSTWDVWIEGRDGGYAVKGTVKTVLNPSVGGKPFIKLKFGRDVSRRGIVGSVGESIPEEHVALQNVIARHEIASDEGDSLQNDFAAEEKTEKEIEGITEKVTEDEPEEETEEETAPYFQR